MTGHVPAEPDCSVCEAGEALHSSREESRSFADDTPSTIPGLLTWGDALKALDAMRKTVEAIAEKTVGLTQRVDNLVLRTEALTQRTHALTQRTEALVQRADALAQRVDVLGHDGGQLVVRGDGCSVPDHDGLRSSVGGSSKASRAGVSSGAASSTDKAARR